MHINNAFLNGDLQEKVYMQQPPGVVDSNTSLVCKLKKAIYGLKQEPCAWHEKLHQALIQFGFVSRKYDHSLFVYNHQEVTLCHIVYVDDTILTRTTPSLLHDLINKLQESFFSINLEFHNISLD